MMQQYGSIVIGTPSFNFESSKHIMDGQCNGHLERFEVSILSRGFIMYLRSSTRIGVNKTR